MNARRPDDTPERFEHAFVAASYLLGRRGHDLLQPLGTSHQSTNLLARGLGRLDQQGRAQLLAAELARIAHALERRRVW